MMSQASIVALQEQAARRASRERKTPYVFWSLTDVETQMTGAPIPFMGTYTASKDGWRPLKYTDLGWDVEEKTRQRGWYGSPQLGVILFAGGGGEDEPALGERGFAQAVELILRTMRERDPKATIGFGIFEAGQFQVNIRVFVKTL